MEKHSTVIDNSTLKDKICFSILMQLQAKEFTKEQLDEVRNAFFLKTKEVEFITTCKALVVSNTQNEFLVRKFYATKFMEGLSPKTLHNYQQEMKRFQRIMNVNLVDVTTDQVRAYLAYHMSHGMGRRTADCCRRYLSTFYNWMFEEGLIRYNPVRKIKKIKWEKKVFLPFSEEEVEAMRGKTGNTRDRALLEMMLSTGCRVSELATATLETMDLQNGTLLVMGKGSKERMTYLNAAARFWMKKYLDERNDTDEHLFVSEQEPHPPLQISGMEIIIRELGRACGIKKAHPHRFRRTAASWASKRGMPIEQIQEMLGHSKLETTMIYAVVDPKAVQRSHEKYLGG